MAYFPLFYKLDQKKLLLVGGGRIALAKLETLVEYAKDITILAKEISEEVREIALDKDLTLIEAEYEHKYVADHAVVIIATDDHDLNNEIADFARSQNKIINTVDDVANSDFIFPAIVKRDNITVAISSGGMSPVLARLLKQKIEKIFSPNFKKLDDFIVKTKDLVRKKLKNIQSRRIFWQEVFEGNIANEILSGNAKKAEDLFQRKLHASEEKDKAALYIIGAGPGDPELITIKAINLLSRADIVLYDRLVAEEILNYARKDALKINVGKTKDFHKFSQDEINKLLRQYVLQGNIVARLKGGDTAIFAHLYEEIEAVKDLDVPYQIVPGITAASGAAAYSGIALTARDMAKSVRILTLYKRDMFNADYWQDLANSDDSLVFYMSAANASLIADNLVKYGKNPETGIAVIEQATTKYQKTYITDLESFSAKYAEYKFISPSLIIVGDVVKKAQEFAWRDELEQGKFFIDLLGVNKKKVNYVE